MITQLDPKLLKLIGIPQSFWPTRIDDYAADGLVARGLDAVMNGRSIYLHGQVGVGKSFVAAYWLCKWMEQNILNGKADLPRFVTVPEMFDDILDGMDDGKRKAVTNPLKRCPVLVLDNYGRGSRSVWGADEIFKVVNARYNNGLPIVLTTTMPFDTFEKNDPDTASRLHSMGVRLHFKGKDRRKK
jgi:primosomal protein DnaI